ncbi:MAG: hypothetical protein C0442_10710 [Chlorobiaceae bacterium]|nr:hypothetical protein [Chlorobiaceae bacterium]
MEKIDKIVFGDNQFFGINHMSQDKAQQLSEKFYDLDSIIKVYEYAFECGIKSIMLNSNDRAKEITDYFRANKSKYSNINWYPSLPYPHKYANLVAEKGIVPAISEVLFTGNTAGGLLSIITKGSAAVLGKDMIKVMQMLIDIEMRAFNGLNIKVIFLQNIISDLLLGLNAKVFFIEFADYVKKKYNVLPGFLTMNLPYMLQKFNEWNLAEAVICSSINKIGYLMSPSVSEYEIALASYDRNKYQVMAMSVLASGAVKPEEAFEFIGKQKIESIVFGASSKKNIVQSSELINKFCVNH